MTVGQLRDILDFCDPLADVRVLSSFGSDPEKAATVRREHKFAGDDKFETIILVGEDEA